MKTLPLPLLLLGILLTSCKKEEAPIYHSVIGKWQLIKAYYPKETKAPAFDPGFITTEFTNDYTYTNYQGNRPVDKGEYQIIVDTHWYTGERFYRIIYNKGRFNQIGLEIRGDTLSLRSPHFGSNPFCQEFVRVRETNEL